MKQTIEYRFSTTEHTTPFDTVEALHKKLIEAAQKAAQKAYAPYSAFNVGAAVLLDNGEIVCGNNQENAAYPSGLCAERVALFFAGANYPQQTIQAIAITAFTGNSFIATALPPCGSCRQVIAESQTKQQKAIQLILAGTKKIIIINNAMNLLPITFEKTILNK